MQELIFWLIFSVVAATLIITQTVALTERPTVPQLTKVELPDLRKKDANAHLIYENEILSEKLSKFPEGKVIIYSLGEFSGPTFNEKSAREGAQQIAFQGLITHLETVKNNLIEQLVSIFNAEKEKIISVKIAELFDQLYQRIPFDDVLAVTYRIWKKNNGEVVTYYYLVIFDDEYARILVESLATDIIQELQSYGISFSDLWRKAINKYAEQIKLQNQ
jgi:transcriptional accessory protein Tex/SPT6